MKVLRITSSDDELETSSTSVSDYTFEDENDQPVSFSVLPLQVVGGDTPVRQISLYGTVDMGLQKISKQVVAWNYDLLSSNTGPVISVLSKDGTWIRLKGRPVKWFSGGEARTILVTLAYLHFVRWNPKASQKEVWDHLCKEFSFYLVKPNQNDLVDHKVFISEAMMKDPCLNKSKALLAVLESEAEKTVRHRQSNALSEFIVDDVEECDYDFDWEKDGDLEEDTFDSVCAFCDNGGFVLCCDGVCLRSFHASGEPESHCPGLGFYKDEVDTIQSFLCENCKHRKHQCFACKKLGVSDKSNFPEVFQCANATCGHFYHPECIAKLLLPGDDGGVKKLQHNIAQGERFICSIHKCAVCNGGESKKELDFQFAVCRRCPTSYHRICLPREIIFAKTVDEGDDEEQEEDRIVYRAWENLLPNRVLIYCSKHEILEDLGTPSRDYCLFPNDLEEGRALANKKSITSKRKRDSEDFSKRKRSLKRSDGISNCSQKTKISVKDEIASSCKGTNNPTMKSLETSVALEKELTGSKKFRSNSMKLGSLQHKTMNSKLRRTQSAKSVDLDPEDLSGSLDAESKKRILNLMNESESGITLKENHFPSMQTSLSSNVVDKTITLGKVKGTVEAVRTALGNVRSGCSVDDAKAVCEPEVLKQAFKWQSKLKVYLAPFLCWPRYTSFGRYFTKVEKLEEIANRLHWYIQHDDMIVDFCCGANDFSWILKGKLEETGKKCSFKNYDLIQSKNDFKFEKRDWMTVETHELKAGKHLIIGLSPPLGVKAHLANKFIKKALQFKPKLVILIVPPETERLDINGQPYDLIWEDRNFFSGKSYYLPGSVDIYEMQMEDWNLTPRVLYFWSRSDWTCEYKAIAEKQGHLLLHSIVNSNPGEEIIVMSNPLPVLNNNALEDSQTDKNGITYCDGAASHHPAAEKSQKGRDGMSCHHPVCIDDCEKLQKRKDGIKNQRKRKDLMVNIDDTDKLLMGKDAVAYQQSSGIVDVMPLKKKYDGEKVRKEKDSLPYGCHPVVNSDNAVKLKRQKDRVEEPRKKDGAKRLEIDSAIHHHSVISDDAEKAKKGKGVVQKPQKCKDRGKGPQKRSYKDGVESLHPAVISDDAEKPQKGKDCVAYHLPVATSDDDEKPQKGKDCVPYHHPVEISDEKARKEKDSVAYGRHPVVLRDNAVKIEKEKDRVEKPRKKDGAKEPQKLKIGSEVHHHSVISDDAEKVQKGKGVVEKPKKCKDRVKDPQKGSYKDGVANLHPAVISDDAEKPQKVEDCVAYHQPVATSDEDEKPQKGNDCVPYHHPVEISDDAAKLQKEKDGVEKSQQKNGAKESQKGEQNHHPSTIRDNADKAQKRKKKKDGATEPQIGEIGAASLHPAVISDDAKSQKGKDGTTYQPLPVNSKVIGYSQKGNDGECQESPVTVVDSISSNDSLRHRLPHSWSEQTAAERTPSSSCPDLKLVNSSVSRFGSNVHQSFVSTESGFDPPRELSVGRYSSQAIQNSGYNGSSSQPRPIDPYHRTALVSQREAEFHLRPDGPWRASASGSAPYDAEYGRGFQSHSPMNATPLSSFRRTMSATQRYTLQLNEFHYPSQDRFISDYPSRLGAPMPGSSPYLSGHQADSSNNLLPHPPPPPRY